MQGIKTVLKDEKDLEMFINYMDTKRCSDIAYFQQLKEIYAHKYANIKFDIILSADDHALNFLLQHRDTFFPETPVVFCGINDFQPSRIEGKKLFTGVSESYDVKSTLEIILKLHSDVKNIKVITDGTHTGMDLMNRVKRAEMDYKDRLSFEYLSNLGLEEINKRLKNSDPQTAIIWTIYLRTPEGRTVTSEQCIKYITNNSSIPVHCIWDVVGKGVVGGRVTSPTLQGSKAAEIALRILHGEDLASFTVSGTPMVNKFDYVQLQKYGIDEKLLPKDLVMINQPFSVYKEYKSIIITTLSIVFLLLVIVFILIHFNKKRRQTAKIILDKNQRLTSVSKELKETNLKLEEAKEKAEESDKLKTAFLANMSHEIRTPMNGILGFTNLLKEKNLTEDTQHQYIDIIN